MQDASWQNQVILQWLSNSPVPWKIDGEIGDLSEDLLAQGEHGNGLISYMRYNTLLDKDYIDKLMSKSYAKEKVEDFFNMDNAANCDELFKIASAAAEKEMLEEHFPKSFVF